MGRSKFPGKPSKHCLRKRINVLPPDGDLFNLVDIISPVTVTTSQDNKKDEEIEEKDTKNKPVKEVKTLKRRISRKLNTSLQKDGRKRAFIAKICAKTSLKVNKTTKRNNFSRNLTFKDSANLGGKFVLPTRSVHSSRVIKPNKRFIELNETLTMKKTVIAQRSVKRDGNKSRIKLARCKDSNFSKPEYDKTSDPNSHRVILRQARLKLPNHINTHVPFSTKTHNGPGTIICGICGAARYYRFVKHAKKFNIYSCESCRKFISKYIKRQNVGSNKSNSTLICLKGQGICYIPPIIRSQHWKINKGTYKSRCPACWLKACLKTYQLPPNLKHSLTQLLPQNMRGLDFSFNNTLPPLWQRNTERIVPVIKPAFQVASKHRPVRFKSSKTQSVFSLSVPSSEIKRQKIDLKGPRVKHVCRSASVALGQPVATFRSEVGKSCDTSDNLDPISKTNDQAKSVNWSVNKSDNLLLSDEDIVCDEHMSMVNYIFNENMDQSKRDRSLLLINGCVKSTETEPDEKGNDNFTSNEIYLDYSSDMNQDNSIKYGHCVIGSQQFSVTGICFLCGSGGKEPMLVCSACCQPYHTFCIEKQTPFTSHSLKGYVWICSMCIKCSECNNSEKPKIQCCKCQKFYHTDCFYSQWDTSGSERRALCKRCLRCNDCGSVFNVKCFPGNTMFCSSCLAKKKYSKKCPICHHTIDDETCCSARWYCNSLRKVEPSCQELRKPLNNLCIMFSQSDGLCDMNFSIPSLSYVE